MTAQKVQDAAADKFRKDDKLRKKAKEKKSTGKEILDQDVADDEAEAAADGDENGGVVGAEGAGESSDDEGSTGEGVGDKHIHGRGDSSSQELRIHFKLFPGYSRRTQNAVQGKCCIIDCTGKVCGTPARTGTGETENGPVGCLSSVPRVSTLDL